MQADGMKSAGISDMLLEGGRRIWKRGQSLCFHLSIAGKAPSWYDRPGRHRLRVIDAFH
jgi:hypothetical protein